MLAPPERPGELSIEEKRHVGLYRAGADRIVRNQPGHRRFDEGRSSAVKKM